MIIYYADIDPLADDAFLEQKLTQVNMQRRAKVLRCKQKKDRMRSLAAGLLLRYGMEDRGISYEDAVFGTDGAGKPLLLSQPVFCYNISHSGNYAACGIWEHDLGVDLECVSERFLGAKGQRLMEHVAGHCFTGEEQRYLADTDAADRPDVFVKIWTGKESFAKYQGTGIAMDFSTIDTLRAPGFFWEKLDNCWLSVYAGGEEIVPAIKKIIF
jgi:4'-phosphopantetheinyl transferase